MDKYYTPTVEEFYVGFEYESLYNDEWIRDQITQTCDIPEDDLEHNDGLETRVKYLDKEDIESLGFEDSNDRGMVENYGYLFTKDSTHFESSKAQLRYWPNTNRVYIYDGQIIFNGTIKNKSELVKLLKQLRINE